MDGRANFGPQQWQVNRIGVTPDVIVTPTPDDEDSGHDPQLAAALEILRAKTGTLELR